MRASIANDLAQGQDRNSPTRELLNHYVPVDGIRADPDADDSLESAQAEPVENSMAPGATLARHATLAPHATVERYAMVKGELRVPNTLNFSLFPTLEPFAKAVYYQLFLLSHGFRKDTCLVGLAKLAKSVLMSQRKVQSTIVYLEKRGLIEKVESKLGGSARGNLYRVALPGACTARDAAVAPGATLAGDATMAPHATLVKGATVARGANNKEKYDDDYKDNHHQRAEVSDPMVIPVENHSRAAAQREKSESASRHFVLVRDAYEKATGNRWKKSDSEAYEANGLRKLPAETIISAIEAVAQRTPAKINSFRYFVQELVSLPEPGNRAWRKKQLEKTVRGVRDSSVGRADYSPGDFVEDVKRACARDAVPFDNDIFNEVVR
ncbi:MAG: hypothetical protein FJW35_10505 [Acidobacteria bacterium]|nr:hypothetical protein [Acidobacteriota bacterium]